MTIDDKDLPKADETEPGKVSAPDIDKLLVYPPKAEERPLEEKGVVIETRYTHLASFCKSLLVFCAGLLAGLLGVWLWSVIVTVTGLAYLKWSSLILILVATGVGYIIYLPSRKANSARAVISAIIVLAAICAGKVLVARSVILPDVESHLRNGVVTVRAVEWLAKSPHWMFVTACKYRADEYKWDKSFTRRVIRDYLLSEVFGRSLPYTPGTKSVSAIKQISETIAASTDSHKRMMVRTVVNRYRGITSKSISLRDAPILSTAQIKDVLVYGLASEMLAGQETPSLRTLGYLIAFGSSFYWFDWVIFPVCLWVAYRINS